MFSYLKINAKIFPDKGQKLEIILLSEYSVYNAKLIQTGNIYFYECVLNSCQ